MKKDGIISRKVFVALFGIALVVGVLCIVLSLANDDKLSSYESTTEALGYIISQSLTAEDPETINSDVTERIEEIQQGFAEDSEVSATHLINTASSNKEIRISQDMFNILSECNEITQKTDGRFSVWTKPLTELWKTDNQSKKIPKKKEIKAILPLVNSSNISLNNNNFTVCFKIDGMGVNLKNVFGGYVCTQVVNIYKDWDITSAFFSVGERSFCAYSKDCSIRSIPIKNPMKMRTGKAGTLYTIGIDNGYVSTSAVYDEFFRKKKKVYSATFNARTGYPIKNHLASVTVKSDNGVISDILSRACLILGRKKSLSLLSEYSAEAVFVTKGKKILATSGLIDNVDVKNSKYKLKLIEQ